MSVKIESYNVKKLINVLKESPKDCIVVSGAGISAGVGLPNWKNLRDVLCERIIEKDAEKGEDVEKIKANENFWNSFSEIKRILPIPIYYEEIKKILDCSNCNVPVVYEQLWKIGIKGFITFNIDQLVERSFVNAFSTVVDSSSSCDISIFPSYISSSKPFVFHPHGKIENHASWIFTNSEKDNLLRKSEYVEFMKTIFRTKHIIVIGFGVDDFSYEYIIEQSFINDGTLPSHHFIISDKINPLDAKSWEDRGIYVIPYKSIDGNHDELYNLFEEISNLILPDKLPSSIYSGEKIPLDKIPSDDDLLLEKHGNIRRFLNGAIAEIIPDGKEIEKSDVDKLRSFLDDYAGSVHMAWLVDSKKYNEVMNYKIIDRIGNGAFGNVYSCERIESNGAYYALKLLREENAREIEWLNSFRRGVKSMKILSTKNVEGMVKYVDAFEIPACVIMEYINGKTLKNVIENKMLTNFTDLIKIICDVGKIVNSAHKLEDKILHRDIKPDNIMLRNFFNSKDDIDVVVLDFDLSWHKGACELSVVHGTRALGYAAPEQVKPDAKVSTRSTLVDTFGYGMLAYYIMTGKDPMPNEQEFKNFKTDLLDTINQKYFLKWKSVGSYIVKVIEYCTYSEQDKRISFEDAYLAFCNVHNWIINDCVMPTDTIILSEIAERMAYKKENIEYSLFGRKVEITPVDPSKTLTVSLGDNRKNIFLDVSLRKTRGEHDNRSIAKYISTCIEKTRSILSKGGFIETEGREILGGYEISGKIFLDKEVTIQKIEKIAETLYNARNSLELK